MRLCHTIATLLAVAGCQDPADADQDPYCQRSDEVVSLDDSLGSWGGDPDFDLTPRKVLDQLTLPQRGELAWKGGGEWVDVTPDSGTTGFASVVTYDGTTVFHRAVATGRFPEEGRVTIVCSPSLDFDVSIRFATDDGILDETWQTTLSFDLDGIGVSAEPDAEALGLPEKLRVSENLDAPAPFYDERYSMRLSYRIDLLSPEKYPPRFQGHLDYGGTISEEKEGEIINVMGFNRTLFEWVGYADGGEPTRRPSG
jgi:hypothetical protein